MLPGEGSAGGQVHGTRETHVGAVLCVGPQCPHAQRCGRHLGGLCVLTRGASSRGRAGIRGTRTGEEKKTGGSAIGDDHRNQGGIKTGEQNKNNTGKRGGTGHQFILFSWGRRRAMSWILARAVLGRLQCRSCPEAVSAFGKAARQKRGDGAIIPRHFRGLWVVPGWCSESRGEVGGIQGHGLVSLTVAGWQSWWYADGACCHRFCVFPPQASLKELF